MRKCFFNDFSYKYVYEGKNLEIVEDIIDNRSCFDDWDIYNKSDELIDNKLVKEDLNNQWNNHVSDTIEDFFSQKIESRWNNVLSYLKTIISSKKTIQTRSEFKDELLEFVAIQYARRDENLRELIIDPTIELACTVFESDEIEKRMRGEIDNDSYKKNLFLSQLYSYIKYKEHGQEKYKENAIKKIIEMLKSRGVIVFLKAPNSVNFITSDNPCYINPNSKDKSNNIAGMFLPLSKDICLYIGYYDQDKFENKYFIYDIGDTNTKYINSLTVLNSIQYVGSSDMSIKKDIDSILNAKEWNEFFLRSWE